MFTKYTSETGALIDSRIADFETRTIDTADAVKDRMETIFVKIDDGLATRTQKMSESVIANALEAAQSINESAESVRSALEDRATRFEQIVVDNASQLVSRMDESARSLSDQLTTRVEGLTGSFDHGIMRLERDVVGRMGSLVATIDERSRGLVNTIDERSRSLVETLNMRSEMVGAALGHQIEEIAAIFNGRGTELVQQIRTNGEVITLAVSQTGENANRQLAGVAEGILRSIETQTDNVTSSFRDHGTSITQTLRDEGLALTESLRYHGLAVTQGLKDQGNNITQSIRVQGEGLTGELKTQGQTLVQELRTQGEFVTSGIREQGQSMAMEVVMQGQIVTKNLQEQTENMTKGLREHGNNVTQELRDQGSAVFDILREESSSMTGQIREHSEAMLVTATNAAERLRDIVENSSTKAVGQLSQVVDALSQTGEPLLQRVSELTESLGDVVVRTDNSLVQLEGMLQTRMHNIEQTLGLIYRESNHAAERVSQHVDVLRQATGTISEQMRNVNETTGTLARLESQFSAAINAREASLARIMEQLTIRSDELTSMSRTHAEMATVALDETEKRARDIGHLLASTTLSTSEAITQQIEALRTMSQRERERLAASVRDVYETALSDITVNTNTASERFRSTAEELLIVSGEVTQELEKTRTTLQRALVELPRESKLANESVREMIGGQLKALDELKALKNITGPGLGISPKVDPQRVDTQPNAPRPQAAAMAQPMMPQPAPSQQDLRAPLPAFQAPETQIPIASMAQQAPSQAPRGIDPAFAPRRAQRAETAQSGSGWLTDVLTRASKEEPADQAPAIQPAHEWLASISQDINQITYPEVLKAYWERVLAGDRSLSVLPSFTTPGLGKIEEARSRYNGDREFRQIVDDYITRFDDHLRNVPAGPQSYSMIRSIIASDQGKVYTLLSALVGRIA
jgi:hypothetical protein